MLFGGVVRVWFGCRASMAAEDQRVRMRRAVRIPARREHHRMALHVALEHQRRAAAHRDAGVRLPAFPNPRELLYVGVDQIALRPAVIENEVRYES